MSENLRWLLAFEKFGIEAEEIEVHGIADSQQQIAIDVAVAKEIVHVLARKIELRGQPCDGSSLPLEFGLDALPDMYLHRVRHVFTTLP